MLHRSDAGLRLPIERILPKGHLVDALRHLLPSESITLVGLQAAGRGGRQKALRDRQRAKILFRSRTAAVRMGIILRTEVTTPNA
jgi:hypothetical protein